MKNRTLEFLQSWTKTEKTLNSTQEIIAWMSNQQEKTHIKISATTSDENSFWYYNEAKGTILNRAESFFSIQGAQLIDSNSKVLKEQPIINQSEVGYLGIIVKKINGILHFLLQAKIEPGNLNGVQLSPTIQATRSNFSGAHGGKQPAYLDYFMNEEKYDILYDQLQSEQAGRFLKKRNRNIILFVEEEIDLLPNFCWVTLGQIKELLKIDNLINMDTRTVLSGIFLNDYLIQDREKFSNFFEDTSLFNSIFYSDVQSELTKAYQILNNIKMFSDNTTRVIPLQKLEHWITDETGVKPDFRADFQVQYYDIEIEGREVATWTQPLFKAEGKATFVLFSRIYKGVRQYLVKAQPEIGSFDIAEFGPSIQWEASERKIASDVLSKVFRKHVTENRGILNQVVLSEEGGRFYHEQNYNFIIEVDPDELSTLRAPYVWLSFGALSSMIQKNNQVNIQLRNLIALINL